MASPFFTEMPKFQSTVPSTSGGAVANLHYRTASHHGFYVFNSTVPSSIVVLGTVEGGPSTRQVLVWQGTPMERFAGLTQTSHFVHAK